jgi:hypothetical protein
LYLVLYGLEAWFLIVGYEHRLRVFENRMLRVIFGHKRDEIIAGWRKLHNEELHKCDPFQILLECSNQGG